MKCKLLSNFKFWLVLTLAVIVAGMTLLGIFGFANAVDYKGHFERSISVDQDVKDSALITEQASSRFFSDKGLKVASYSTQKSEAEHTIIYKFKEDDSSITAELKDYVEAQFTSEGRVVSVNVYEAEDAGQSSLVSVIIAIVITAVAVSVLLMIMDKFAVALSVLFSGILSFVVYLALINLFRIPAMPYLAITTVGAFALAMAFAYVATDKFNEIASLSGNEKLSYSEIANLGAMANTFKYAVLGLSTLVVSALMMILGGGYFAVLGLQLIALNFSVLLSCYVWLPRVWATLKGLKK